MIVVHDELNVSARLACGLALVAYIKTAEVLGLDSQDLSGCLEPVHKLCPWGGYVQSTENPRELASAIRREQMSFLPGDWRTQKEIEEEAQAQKRATHATQRAQKRKARQAAPASMDEWREQPAPRSAASSRGPSRAASPSRPGPSWANITGSSSQGAAAADAVTSPGVPGIADWVSQVDLDVDRYLDESEKMCTGTDSVDMDSNYDDAHENM